MITVEVNESMHHQTSLRMGMVDTKVKNIAIDSLCHATMPTIKSFLPPNDHHGYQLCTISWSLFHMEPNLMTNIWKLFHEIFLFQNNTQIRIKLA